MVGSVNSYSSTRKRRRSGQSDASSSIISEDAALHAGGASGAAGGSSLPIDLLSPASSNLSAKKRPKGIVMAPGNLQSLILNIFENVRVVTNENGKLLCESLMRMPTRRSNPEYYEVVKEPIDFSIIQKNVKSAKYSTMEQFVHDVQLMVENEKLYHRRSSQEHKDACEFWNMFLSVKHEAEVLESVTRASESEPPKQTGVGQQEQQQVMKSSPSTSKQASISGSGAPVGQVMQNLSPSESRMIIAHVMYNLLSVHEDDRYIAEIFKRVPSAQSYPIYYEVITNPIDFWMIFKKLKLEQYDSLQQFEEDVTLVINNAKTFNEPGSQVFKDALTIKKLASSLIYKFQIEKAPEDEHLIQKIEAFFEEYLTSSDSESADDSELNTSSETLPGAGGGKVEDDSMAEDVDDEEHGIGVSPYWALWTCVITPVNPVTGIKLCKQFKLLPNKKVYPDYYTEIKRPMSLARIKSKIKKSRYRDLNHCFDDFRLMFNNCLKYNRVDSQIYRDAEFLLDAVTQRKADIDFKGVDSEEFVSNKRKPGRKPGTKLIPLGPDGTPCPELKTDLDQLRKRLRSLYNVIAKHSEPNGRETAEMFMQLPSKEKYPVYYEYIKNPIDLKMIDRKIRCNEYNSEEEFMNDFCTMFSNARDFNEEGSQIHNDAIRLEALLKEKKASFTPMEQPVKPAKSVARGRAKLGGSKLSVPPKKRINFGMASVRPGYGPSSSSQSNGNSNGADQNQSFSSPNPHHVIANTDFMANRAPLSPIVNPVSNSGDCPTLVLPSPSMFNQNSNASTSSVTPGHYPTTSQQSVETASPASQPMNTPCSTTSAINAIVTTTVDKIAFSNPMQRKLFTLYEAVKMKRSPRTGRELYEPFYRLPTRNDMPEYYKIITKPIDMQKIYQKMSSNGYEDLNELVDDFVLMFNNACKFNEPGSRIYKDAILLMRVLIEKKHELTSDGSCSNDNAKVPVVSEVVNMMLQRVFLFTVNKEDEDGRCYSDSLYPIVFERASQGLPPLSLDIISRNLDTLVYKRLDHLQSDLFALLYYIRNVTAVDSEAFEDSLDMQLFFMRKRDEMTKNGETLFSPALHVGSRQIEKETEEQRRSQPKPSMPPDCNFIELSKLAMSKYQIPDYQDVAVPVAVPGRYIFITPTPNAAAMNDGAVKRHILYVKEIQDNFVAGELFLFPDQVESFPGRKFLNKEVLHYTAPGGYPYTVSVSTASIIGPQCHVMHIKDFTRFSVAKLNENCVFICESQFRANNPSDAINIMSHQNSNELHRGIICKLKAWTLDSHPSISFVKREFKINRVDRRALADRVAEDQNLMPHTQLYCQQFSDLYEFNPLLFKRNSLLAKAKKELLTNQQQQDVTSGEHATFYEQCVVNGKVYRLGDGIILPLQSDTANDPHNVLVNNGHNVDHEMKTEPGVGAVEEEKVEGDGGMSSSADIDQKVDEYVKSKLLNKDEDAKDALTSAATKPDKSMRRIEKMWKDREGVVWFSGSWYLLPCQVEHEPTRMFYKNELIVAEIPQHNDAQATEMNQPSRLDHAQGTFTVMILREYTVCRPTEYNEADVYICDNKYFPDDKIITKLKKGLRMPIVSKKLHLDEVYNFKKPIALMKEASPFLFSHEIEMDDIMLDSSVGSGANNLDPSFPNELSTGDEDVTGAGSSGGVTATGAGSSSTNKRGYTSKNNVVPGQKKASGYIAFASIMRPKLKEMKPELEFGELSKEVGNRRVWDTKQANILLRKQWNDLSVEEKDLWHKKAEEKASTQTPRAAEPCAGYESSTPVVVYECCWEGCDFMFEDEADMFTHLIKDETTHINGAVTENGFYKCLWGPCYKGRKNSKVFPNPNRLGRHLRESHFKYAARYIYPPQISRHFVSKGMLGHFQQNPQPPPPGTVGATTGHDSMPTWGQTEVVGGIIPTPQAFRSLTHDVNHMWNVVHVQNPYAPQELPQLSVANQGNVQSGAQISSQSQFNQNAINVVSGENPYSPGQPRPAFQTTNTQLATNGPLIGDSAVVGQVTSTPNRGQQVATAQPAQQHPQQATPMRPTFVKQVSGVGTALASTPQGQLHPQQNGVVNNSPMHRSVPPSAPPPPAASQQQVDPNVPPSGPITQPPSGTHLQPAHPPHVPDVVAAPTPQSMPNPYRQGTFEAHVYNHMSSGPLNPPPPPNVFTADGKPLFTMPPIKRTPLTHTKVYLDYIKNLPNKHVTDLKKTLAPPGERPNLNKQTASAAAGSFFRSGTKMPQVTKALWALRDYMLKDSVSIANYNRVPDIDVDMEEFYSQSSSAEQDGRELSVQDF